jgi:hypothetical protein
LPLIKKDLSAGSPSPAQTVIENTPQSVISAQLVLFIVSGRNGLMHSSPKKWLFLVTALVCRTLKKE